MRPAPSSWDAPPGCPGPGLVRSLREELEDRLGPVVAGLGGGRLVVDAYSLQRALQCPAQLAAPADPFAWNLRFALRKLGVEALGRLLAAESASPAEAVRAVEARLVREGPVRPAGSLEGWFVALAPGARASVLAAVTTWVTAAWANLPPELATLELRAGGESSWSRPGRPSVTLRGRAEFLGQAGEGAAARPVVVAVRSDAPGPATEAALRLLALATALATGRSPWRAVALHPQAGCCQVLDVTEAVLRRTADEAVGVASALGAARRRADALDRRPGRHCGWCARRDDCAEGTTWLAGDGRRRAGILPFD